MHFDHERRLWSVGVQAFMTGAAFLRTRNLVGIARPYMRALMNESTETVNPRSRTNTRRSIWRKSSAAR